MLSYIEHGRWTMLNLFGDWVETHVVAWIQPAFSSTGGYPTCCHSSTPRAVTKVILLQQFSAFARLDVGQPKVTKVTKDRSSRSSNFYQEPRASLPRCEAHQDPSCQAGSRQLGLGKMVKSQTADDGGKLGDIKVLTIIWLKSKTITPGWTWWWWWG